MSGKSKTPKEAFDKVLRISLSFSNEARHQLAEAYKEYLETLPPNHRNLVMVILNGKEVISVKRSEIPKKILEDDKFFNIFVNHLARIASKNIR